MQNLVDGRVALLAAEEFVHAPRGGAVAQNKPCKKYFLVRGHGLSRRCVPDRLSGRRGKTDHLQYEHRNGLAPSPR